MFNLSRHAAHHVASRPYWALALEADSPKLPAGLPLCVVISLVPPWWHRKMAKRLARWDREHATEAELDLLRAEERLSGGWRHASVLRAAQR
jgi:alkane 1-monooxygenase